MTAIVTRGNAADLHLPDESVDLVVTSPPYFGLRSYQDGGEHYEGQVGAEATPAEYLDALIACTVEWMRVLKPGGSIFVNLGDKYVNGSASGGHRGGGLQAAKYDDHKPIPGHVPEGFRPKSLMLLPQRYAIRACDDLGLILRAEIVWAKPNGLPESVTDRVRRSHEQVFHLVKQPRYYSAVDEIREEHSPVSIARGKRAYNAGDQFSVGQPNTLNPEQFCNPLGKLPGSVWTIATSPLRVPESLGIDHFAAYPAELVRRIVLGWSPREVCTACGEGRRPVTESRRTGTDALRPPVDLDRRKGGHHGMGSSTLGPRGVVATITGYVCACPDTTAPSAPGVVLDPFGGTGTTALVASVLGRVGISVDLSADYCRLAQWRTTDEKQRAKVAALPTRPKPARAPQPPAAVVRLPTAPVQDVLFGEGEWTA